MKNTKKLLIIGHLVEGRFDGQQSKINDVKVAFEKNGFDIEILNYGSLSLFSILSSSRKAIKRNQNILLMPGGKKTLFLYTFLSGFFKNKNFYYLSIGGWVTDLMQRKSSRRKLKNLKKFKTIVLQNKKTLETFQNYGFNNTLYIPTFSSRQPLSDEQFKQSLTNFESDQTFRFCFFARIIETKGIFEACRVVKRLVSEHYNIKLDIYGQIQDKTITSKFEENLDDNIRYHGVIHNDVIETLSSYYCMLFPTYYKGEGMAHSIIESFMSGLPVIATDWRFNSELIENNKTGFLIDVNDLENNLYNQMVYAIKNKKQIGEMRHNCFFKSKQFNSGGVLKPFIDLVTVNDNL